MKSANDTELLREVAEEIIAHSTCPLCFSYQWRHKHWCPMPKICERFGIQVDKQGEVAVDGG